MENIKAEAFEEYMNDHFPKTKVITIGDIDIEVKTHLTFDEMLDFVDGIVDRCFQDDGDTYIPEFKDYLIRESIIVYYTNIELPETSRERYDFVYGSDLIARIVDEAINKNEFNNILQAIDSHLMHMGDVYHLQYKQKIDEIYSSITAVTEQVASMYADMSSEELADLVKAVAGMADGSVDDEAIAKAVMNFKASEKKEEVKYDRDDLVKEDGE